MYWRARVYTGLRCKRMSWQEQLGDFLATDDADNTNQNLFHQRSSVAFL